MIKLIIYEDTSVIIFNKPQGLATATGKIENLVDMVFDKFPELKEVKGYKKEEGGLLNRLDNETGGLVIFAKNSGAFDFYSNEMKKERVEKIYAAVVDGIPISMSGVIDTPIAHHLKSKKKMIIVQHNNEYRGRPQQARTEWRLIKQKGDRSLLEVKIRKGRRHQIRVHLASKGLPICGDKLYNKIKSDFENHLLYAVGLKFVSFYDMKEKEVYIKDPFTPLL